MIAHPSNLIWHLRVYAVVAKDFLRIMFSRVEEVLKSIPVKVFCQENLWNPSHLTEPLNDRMTDHHPYWSVGLGYIINFRFVYGHEGMETL